ncbi:hypothetical protein JRO89_XS12G0253500 [Xanthoceras sorbifolium]|uniref:Uncharacterized protein n=1 Tax=Xanthoceras sorbifolium TaxID=99658 RepID=A0ABQ8HE09_9ROSI|nr:hypothetical protein JRO89_XS12G0253500 [Xanthoceras sorbifolium]
MAAAAEIQNGQVDLNRHQSNGTQPAILAEAEKQPWLKREAVLEETIKRLQEEKDHHIQKEATLEETIKLLQNESDSHMEKLVTLEETIKQLRNENELQTQKEDTLEETIKQLRNENDSHTQKEVGLEMNIVKLQCEKDLWLQKEARLEVKISQLLDESADLSSKGSISKGTIASLNNDVTRLQMQVTELEESRKNLLQENQQLAEHASSLQLQIQNLERSISSAHSFDDHKEFEHASEQEDLNAQIEAGSALVGKLITENAELVEKVNELFVKLQQQSMADRLSSTSGNDPLVRTVNAAEPLFESSENVSILSDKMESPEVVEVKEERIGVIHGHAVPAASTDSIGEIVQIPLDDNEVQDVESQVVESEEKDGVPLTDAPLIGAPFRLISFVANYVSGSDLVNNKS